ncbi:hypothetical protein ACFO9Q_10720 [Paenibacillus sp. GCM10023252]|uniref:hypothetical protein n=1 Tax=Paenibacillus sp. GCM10023252 TaxID=3252649 RepID=UPI003608699B
MKRYMGKIIVCAMLTAMISACSEATNEPVTAPQAVDKGHAAIELGQGQTNFERLLEVNLHQYVQLPIDEGGHVNTFRMVSDDELVYVVRNAGSAHDQQVSYNLKMKKASRQLQQQAEQTARASSPDGNWVAYWDDSRQGIRGVNKEGEEFSWTEGPEDTQVLWMPDSSGFLFLHATGKQLGDGAGPEYELARYDLGSRQMKVLPLHRGFWGRIEWLVPGQSLLARNGFDDAVGYKLVHLEEPKEIQLLDTTYGTSAAYATYNGAAQRLLITENGSFRSYDTKGDLLTTQPWPVDLDAHSSMNPEYGTSSSAPYYEEGSPGGAYSVNHPSFSPTGDRLAYLLGVFGFSSDTAVTGTRLVVSHQDGGEAKLATSDYLPIIDYQWSPSTDELVVLLSSPDSSGSYYLGVVKVGTSDSQYSPQR